MEMEVSWVIKNHSIRCLVVLLLIAVLLLPGCGGSKKADKKDAAGSVTLTIAAYTVPKEAYQKGIIPAFQKHWKETAGQTVTFVESYNASGAQARNIVNGLEADVAPLSLEADMDTIQKAGLITHDWRKDQNGGMITRSVVALGVKKGNPLNIKDWDDLTRSGVKVLYPNPATSGGAMWDINAIYGAGLKMSDQGQADKAAAEKLLAAIQKNVVVMDKSGRESMTTFEKGVGDVVVTYENELMLRNMDSPRYDIVYPQATILIENPVALVDKNVDKHGNRKVAEAFVDFLHTSEAQRIFARYGFRSVDAEVAREFVEKYPEPPLLFDIEYLGGWDKVKTEIYGPAGVWTRIAEGR